MRYANTAKGFRTKTYTPTAEKPPVSLLDYVVVSENMGPFHFSTSTIIDANLSKTHFVHLFSFIENPLVQIPNPDFQAAEMTPEETPNHCLIQLWPLKQHRKHRRSKPCEEKKCQVCTYSTEKLQAPEKVMEINEAFEAYVLTKGPERSDITIDQPEEERLQTREAGEMLTNTVFKQLITAQKETQTDYARDPRINTTHSKPAKKAERLKIDVCKKILSHWNQLPTPLQHAISRHTAPYICSASICKSLHHLADLATKLCHMIPPTPPTPHTSDEQEMSIPTLQQWDQWSTNSLNFINVFLRSRGNFTIPQSKANKIWQSTAQVNARKHNESEQIDLAEIQKAISD